MNGGLRGPPITCPVKNVDQMENVNPYSNGIPKDLPNKTKDNHWVSKVDEKEAEESLSLYCKPVELYNIIQQRSEQKPLFLQRCLSYKINAAMQRRIRMTVSVTGCAVGKSKGKDTVSSNWSIVRSVFVMVTRAVTYPTEDQVVYQLRPAQNLEFGGSLASAGVSFILPEIRKLVQDGKSGDVLFVVGDPVVIGRSSNVATFDHCTGSVVWGRVAISVLCLNWLKHAKDYALLAAPNGHVVESKLMVELRHGNLQLEDSKAGKIIRISATAKTSTERSLVQLQVLVSGGEIGQATVKGIPANGKCPQQPSQPYSLSHFRSSKRVGRVVYHYLYYHGMLRKTEVTEDFSCPFCLNGCASFKGLQGHLNASHDLFNFGYMVSGELQVVTVTCRPDGLAPEGTIGDGDGLDDPRSKDFFYWFQHSRLRRRRLPLSSGEHLQETQSTHALSTQGASDLANGSDSRQDSDLQEAGDQNNRSVNPTVPAVEFADDEQNLGDSSSQKPSNKHPNGLSLKGLKYGDTISLQQEPRKLHDADGLGLVVKQRSVLAQKRQRMKGVLGERTYVRSCSSPTFGGACASAGGQDLDDCGQQQSFSIPNKAAIDRPDIPRTHALLQKRQYFHSHTAQPMDPEDLFGDRDSEDEIDSVIADLEDQRMLDDFVDVTPEEKEVMHLWNSFVRRNRVVADGHCPWACGEFSRENAQLFRENPALRRCLMLFLVKLWNHHLVDGRTINQCLTIVDSYVSKEQEDPKK